MKNRSVKAIVGAVLMGASCTSAYMTLSNYLYPIALSIYGESEAMANLSSLSLIFTFAAVATIVSSLLMGKILQKIPMLALNLFAIVCFILFYAILSFANSIPLILFGAVLLGLCMTFGGNCICMTVISWWADEKIAARAISALNIALGAASFLSSPIIASCIEKYGRITALFQGVICGALMLIAAVFLISNHPGKYADVGDTFEKKSQNTGKAELPGASLKSILKTSPFWLLMFGMIIINIGLMGFTSNAATFYQTFGVSAVQASYGISVYSIGTLVWSYIFGWLTDKKGLRTSTFILGTIGSLTLVAGIFLKGMIGVLIMGAGIAAICFASALASLILPRMYGEREAGTLIGCGNAAASVGAMLGAPVAVYTLSATGGLKLFLILSAVMVFSCVLIVQVICKEKTVQKMNQLQN